jgi:hypothetical protein
MYPKLIYSSGSTLYMMEEDSLPMIEIDSMEYDENVLIEIDISKFMFALADKYDKF